MRRKRKTVRIEVWVASAEFDPSVRYLPENANFLPKDVVRLNAPGLSITMSGDRKLADWIARGVKVMLVLEDG